MPSKFPSLVSWHSRAGGMDGVAPPPHRPLSAHGGFRRLYLTLFFSLMAIFWVGLVASWLIDDWREDHYRQRLASGPMALLTSLVASQPESSRDAWLSAYEDELGIRLALSDSETLMLGFMDRRRLAQGEVLARQAQGEIGWQLYQRLPGENDAILVAHFTGLSEQQPLQLVSLLRQWLELSPDDEREARFQELRSRISLPMGMGSGTPPGLSNSQLEQLNAGHVVINVVAERSSLGFYAQFSGGRWIMVGPLSPFESLPILTIATVMALMLTLLGTAIYLIMRSVEKRLTRLEQTTASFTAGDYNARVTIQEGEYLTQLGLAFNTMADQVQAVLSSQQDLMRAVSHEFRTPVARVRFALQMVDDMSESPGIRRLLKGVDDDIESIDRLIDEILTYARLDSATDGLLPLEPVSLEVRDIADRVVETLTPLHPQLTFEVTGGQDLNVHADARYLQRALQNLVSNACTHASSRIHVRLLGDERMVYLSVEDDGAGVPLEERERIFKPFARIDDSRTRHQPGIGGYGLGLAIVARIVHWHHGRITVDTAPELGGAQFILSLPRHYEAAEDYA